MRFNVTNFVSFDAKYLLNLYHLMLGKECCWILNKTSPVTTKTVHSLALPIKLRKNEKNIV